MREVTAMTRPPTDDTTSTCCCKPPVHHVHGRDWRPCPATMPAPLRPTKAVSRWMFAFAEAVQHDVTLIAFVNAWPHEFPRLAGNS